MTEQLEIRERIAVRKEAREETIQEVLMILEGMEKEARKQKQESWDKVDEWHNTLPEFRTEAALESRKISAHEDSATYYAIRRIIEEVTHL